ncbi:GlxA family transcriptional regulator [Yinghuangia sp. YIM S10712]|uniref:GlxA family transcriptional regulator n=1 Tax=Yinghuangia sp. YIM S10712 TaxID=3436930 RepID=UPI003F533EA2
MGEPAAANPAKSSEPTAATGTSDAAQGYAPADTNGTTHPPDPTEPTHAETDAETAAAPDHRAFSVTEPSVSADADMDADAEEPDGDNGPDTADALSHAEWPTRLTGRRRADTIAVLLFANSPILESSIPISVFGVDRRDAGVPNYRLLVCAAEPGPLRTTGGVELIAPHGLDGLHRAGTVIVPAWHSPSRTPPAPVLEALRRAHREGARVVGLCGGAFVLAAAGLLDERPATTHWMYAPALAKSFPKVRVDPRELYVDDGDVLTSAGTAAGIDLCLHLVRIDHGSDAANALARRLVVPAHRVGGQAAYMDLSLPEEISGDPLATVISWALENLSEKFDIEVLATRAYMSRRTFDRRFRSLTGSAPLQWLLTQRVLQAQRMLETTDLQVEEIARRCGFRSPVALRGHFRKQLGIPPAAYREAFRTRDPEEAEAADAG